MVENARPRIAILGRIAESTSVTRHGGLVTALRLAEAVWAAGGEPVTFLPVPESDWDSRLQGINGILLPGGGDLNPHRYGEEPTTAEIYGVVDLQDETDLSLFNWAVQKQLPLLAICRGHQVVNVAMNGNLVQDMASPHRHLVHPVRVQNPELLGLETTESDGAALVTASCYHHQAVKDLAAGLTPIATSEDGVVEATAISEQVWQRTVQWHPEDNFDSQPQNLRIFEAFVEACRV
ncbi:MAG: gamma-glutamyl-gamma-aminobutyrate hydrolase family protein [Micrococcales bacterium]